MGVLLERPRKLFWAGFILHNLKNMKVGKAIYKLNHVNQGRSRNNFQLFQEGSFAVSDGCVGLAYWLNTFKVYLKFSLKSRIKPEIKWEQNIEWTNWRQSPKCYIQEIIGNKLNSSHSFCKFISHSYRV